MYLVSSVDNLDTGQLRRNVTTQVVSVTDEYSRIG